EQPEVTALLGDSFDAQADWQSITDGAAEALTGLGGRAEIILLTAMPHRHRAARRAHLDALGLAYPLLTTEMAKGPAVARLRGKTGRPVVFVDNSLRAFLPPVSDDVIVVQDWHEAAPKIASALGLQAL
ncbi:MAG: hypothetical protein E5W64_06270, partial [Mesorhizobium sp.]